MPPKVRIQKATITQAAYDLIKEEGLEAFNARSLAKKAGCSTQPIFSAYQSMEDVILDVKSMAREDLAKIMEKTRKADMPLLGIGEAYIRFAGQNKEMFGLLFGTKGDNEVYEMMYAEGVLRLVQQDAGISQDSAKELVRAFFHYCHGIATCRVFEISGQPVLDSELKAVLKDFYKSYRKLYRKREEA